LLTRAADRIAAVIGDDGRLARLGGDEFAVLLPAASMARAGQIAASIVERLSFPFLVNAQVIDIGASVGVAVAPEHGATPATLVRNADLAMYAAKDSGRSRWMSFDAAMHSRVQERRNLELDLRRAVARREFDVAYQPLFDAADGQWCGAEALLRWPHAARGLVSPALFVPLAEEIGLIGEIGQWVLAQAAAEACRWPDTTHLAVNVSPRQLADAGLVDRVAAVLAETGLPPARLELEVTESALLADEERTRLLLSRLRDLGVGLALDDFGTGFSSLSALHRYPFTRLKIDRSFITGCTDDAGRGSVVRTIAVLAHTLGMAVTAEGVETGAQRQFVTDLGCDTLQGYLLGRPMPAADIRRLANGRRRHLKLAEGSA
jgi:predicted signal transduction protein with EAL and GGDEF domain